MAGPCFTLLYRSFGAGEWADLTNWVSSLAGGPIASNQQECSFALDESVVPRISRAKEERHSKRTCEYVLSLRDSSFESKPDRAAIERSLGYVPNKAITACAMCRDAFNTDGLLFLQQGLIGRIGGWFVFESAKLPPGVASLKQGLVLANVADYRGYFGAGPVDPAYVAQYEEFVPRKTLYFVDAKATGFRHLDA